MMTNLMFSLLRQPGVTLTMACVLGGINHRQMTLTGHWHLDLLLPPPLVPAPVKEAQVGFHSLIN